MKELKNVDRKIERIDGKLFELFDIQNDKGETVRRFEVPLKVELRIHDILEIIVGASILAVPVAFTEEVWDMGEELPWLNTLILSFLSLVFIGCFVYYSSYRIHLKMFRREYLKRVLSIFLLSFFGFTGCFGRTPSNRSPVVSSSHHFFFLSGFCFFVVSVIFSSPKRSCWAVF